MGPASPVPYMTLSHAQNYLQYVKDSLKIN